MKKQDFKKLALLGIAGGVLVAGEPPVEGSVVDYSTTLASGCGGVSGCGHRSTGSSDSGYQANRNVNSNANNAKFGAYQNDSDYPTNHWDNKEGYRPDERPNQQARPNQPMQQQYQPQAHGCGAPAAPQYIMHNTPVAGCGGMQQHPAQVQQMASCGAPRPSNQGYNGGQAGAYTQWETGYTADNARMTPPNSNVTPGTYNQTSVPNAQPKSGYVNPNQPKAPQPGNTNPNGQIKGY